MPHQTALSAKTKLQACALLSAGASELRGGNGTSWKWCIYLWGGESYVWTILNIQLDWEELDFVGGVVWEAFFGSFDALFLSRCQHWNPFFCNPTAAGVLCEGAHLSVLDTRKIDFRQIGVFFCIVGRMKTAKCQRPQLQPSPSQAPPTSSFGKSWIAWFHHEQMSPLTQLFTVSDSSLIACYRQLVCGVDESGLVSSLTVQMRSFSWESHPLTNGSAAPTHLFPLKSSYSSQPGSRSGTQQTWMYWKVYQCICYKSLN